MVDSTAPPMPPSVPVPQVVTRKRTVLIATSIGVVVFVLLIFSALAVWLLQRSAQAPTPPAGGSFPAATDSEATEPLASSVTPAPGTTISIPTSLKVPEQNNLGVAIIYNQQPRFNLRLAAVTQTSENVTPHRRQPAEGSTYSLLRVKNAQGAIIHEQFFAVATQVELLAGEPLPSSAPIFQLPSSTAYLVIPVQSQNPPVSIELVGADGSLFDSRSFTFIDLPSQLTTSAEVSLSQRPGIWGNALARLKRLVSPARAQTPPMVIQGPRSTPTPDLTAAPDSLAEPPPVVIPGPLSTPTPPPAECTSNCFVIAVVSAEQSVLAKTVQETRQMVHSLEPWKTYADRVRVVPVRIKTPEELRCYTIEGLNGKDYPLCPDESAVAALLNGVVWHVAVVATGVNCNCGVVEDINTSSVAAVGSRTDQLIIGHELGHAVGRMVDEYYYQYGFAGGPLGPNCFDSETSCQTETSIFADAACSLGCRTTASWRPSTQLMHNWPNREYGPLETCIMAEQIRKVVGGDSRFGACEAPDKQFEPAPPPAREGDYYGGRR